MGKRIVLYITVFIIGAVGYGAIEILWRGHTHISMLLLGGLCFSFMRYLTLKKINIFIKSLVSALFIIGGEFAVGCIVNLWLHLKVWDYSAYRYNLLGQICLLYSVLWFLLSFAVIAALQLSAILFRRLPRFVRKSDLRSSGEQNGIQPQ